MEEQQIKNFVHRVSRDEDLRKELTCDPDGVIMREGFSPRVAAIIAKLVPHLSIARSFEGSTDYWW